MIAVVVTDPSTLAHNASQAIRSRAARREKKPSIVAADPKIASAIHFQTKLLRPRLAGKTADWMFLLLPKEASSRLPSRGLVTVAGTLNGAAFIATLQPDGKGGHWMKADRKLCKAATAPGEAGLTAGDVVSLEITPMAAEPEPKMPSDLRKALAAAAPGKGGKPGAREVWADITPAARRDFIHWITSGKKAETRAKRIATACDMLAKGKRRPCCFDRSGMYSKSLSCPVAEDAE